MFDEYRQVKGSTFITLLIPGKAYALNVEGIKASRSFISTALVLHY